MARSSGTDSSQSLEAMKRSLGTGNDATRRAPEDTSRKRRTAREADHPAALTAPARRAFAWQTALPALAILLCVAVGFGGGGVRYGFANLIVQLTALAICGAYSGSFLGFWREAPIMLRLLVVASIALPVLHTLPLPPALWTALPGRELAVQARDLTGGLGWASHSLDTSRSLVALSGLIAPLAVLAIGWKVPRDRLVWLGWVIVALGIVNLISGAFQVLSTARLTSFYPENAMPGVLFGTFANRNSTGVFLVAVLSLAALLPSPVRNPGTLGVRLVVCVLLLVGILLTQSRTALVLAAIPLGLAVLRALGERMGTGKDYRGTQRGAGAIVGLCLAAGLAIAGLGIAAPGRLGDTLDRFQSDSDPRAYIWEDALYSVDRYWPVGAGMGTFDEVFQIDESLENLTQRRAGRAHNDYIEVAIEAGLPGLAVIGGWLALIAWLSIRASRSPYRWMAWSGAAILLAVALQSITDYPLRNQTMLCVGALALLFLARGAQKDPKAEAVP